MAKKEKNKELPSIQDLETEKKRLREKKNFNFLLGNTVNILMGVAAFAILLSFLLFPVLQIYGVSMTPTLEDGQLVICTKTSHIEKGDIVAFYFNNKILVKRVIAKSGDWINIDEDGFVYINNVKIDEPYINAPAFGDCDIELPHQVPENKYFFMGDHRDTSIDSRNSMIGDVSEEQIVGKLELIVWPLEDFGKIQ